MPFAGHLPIAGHLPKLRRACASRWRRAIAIAAAPTIAAILLAGCSGTSDLFPNALPQPPAPAPAAMAPIAPPPAPSLNLGTGAVKVGLILPLSATGNAGTAGQAMRNAAEMALAEFSEPNIQLLAKDDSGTGQGAQFAAQQVIDEGAEIILGPLFAHSVTVAKQVVRAHGVPIIAFSTDTNVASSGVYLLSFLPESDVDRIVAYAISQGKRSFVGLIPSNAYGTVVEGEFKQAVARRGGRVIALEHYPEGKVGDAVRVVTQAAGRADALFIPDSRDGVTEVMQALATAGINLRQFALLGTQLWDDPLWDNSKVFANPLLEGGWYPAPDPAGFRAFAGRYRSRYGQDPPRPAALAYDAVALVAALVKTQGAQRITNEILANPSGFAGIDGVFRFRNDGTNQRGLAVLRVTPSGGQVISPASRNFSQSAI
jgi:branched-chain amino acid transport system substrate-binding protein